MKLTRQIEIDKEDLEYLNSLAAQGNTGMFHLPEFRRHMATKRLKTQTPTIETFRENSKGITPGTIGHNITELTERGLASSKRTVRLIGPLSALSPVYETPENLKVLTIGPRTEMEIFHLIAIGIQPKNIYGLDLISYSEYVKTGDMHAIPFKDDFFDIVISSWTLGYSSEPAIVMREMSRVIKSSGLIAIGYTHDYRQESYVTPKEKETHIAGCSFRTSKELLSYFNNINYKVQFVQEPKDANASKMMVIIRALK